MLTRKMMKRRDQRGLTLAETLLVLAIGTVAIVGGTILYLQASGAQKVNETVNNLNALQGQISQLYSSQPSYGNAEITQTLISAGVVPSNMIVSGGATDTMRNAWGGDVEIHPTSGGTGYRISFEGVPQDACISLMTKLAGSATGSALRGFTVATGSAPTGANPTNTPPVDIAAAIGACGSDTDNGMSMYYR